MNPAPFLILGLGGFFCLLLYAAKDNKVRRRRSLTVRFRANVAPMIEAFRRLGASAAAFQQSLVQLSAVLALPVEEAERRMRAAMRLTATATPADAKDRILREWSLEFRRPFDGPIVKTTGLD